jgi:NADP-dependent aldehyde dehydrogenase
LITTSYIAYDRGSDVGPKTHPINPATGTALEPGFAAPSREEVELAISLAASAFSTYRNTAPAARAAFLRAIAEEINADVDAIAARGQLETALPEARLRGETARTVGQLRMFADMLDAGTWLDARIEEAMPERQPLPKPDIRSMLRPLGPVAVFCASNFPLAFSVAGGDTASALAAGCPVIAKAHSSHPGVAAIAAAAIVRAALRCEMPAGVFSLLYGSGMDVGMQLVKHPAIKAVGFTGSFKGGKALMDAAAARPVPIPVYAEMSSINPVIMLPATLEEKSPQLAEGFLQSLTLGVGQFCTNPGLLFLVDHNGEALIETLTTSLRNTSPGVMLNAGICQAYADATELVAGEPGIKRYLSEIPTTHGQGLPQVFVIEAKHYLGNAQLTHEMFGPASLIVIGSKDEIIQAIDQLDGQLTGSIHGTSQDFQAYQALIDLLEQRVGRLVFNGFPTGVEVCHSMVHGGPYPSTSDGRSTSVGTMAVTRFTRPIAWQNCPQELLPSELRNGNPLGIPRLVNGSISLL